MSAKKRPVVDHELKITPRFFGAVVDGRKTFELREDDRSFRVGQIVELREHDGEAYTGQRVFVRITYLLRLEDAPVFIGSAENKVIFAFVRVR